MPSYYDIDDILVESRKLPCKFNFSIPGLGYLSGRPGEAIKADDRVELPMWLADILAVCAVQKDLEEETQSQSEQQAFVRLLSPDCFSKQFLNFIKSDPLRSNIAPYAFYYKVVAKWSYMFNDQELVELISKMFVARASQINGLSYKSNDQFTGNNREFLNGLDMFERDLFKLSHLSYKDMKEYSEGEL